MSISQNNIITLREFPRFERRERRFFSLSKLLRFWLYQLYENHFHHDQTRSKGKLSGSICSRRSQRQTRNALCLGFIYWSTLQGWLHHSETIWNLDLPFLNFRNIHMKTILIVLVGVLVWTNNDARTFTAKALYRAAEFVSPEPETRSIGETIDEIFSRWKLLSFWLYQ